ncbi:MAG: hypothetical protein J0I20_02200 [Chloroflexi bacterium]|nr:hypothetical protein [Chloroflexota bacterium]OJV89417.1 MAG: hypothetical protein BGO39_36175 [Chloroflexi bacterium 54-19]
MADKKKPDKNHKQPQGKGKILNMPKPLVNSKDQIPTITFIQDVPEGSGIPYDDYKIEGNDKPIMPMRKRYRITYDMEVFFDPKVKSDDSITPEDGEIFEFFKFYAKQTDLLAKHLKLAVLSDFTLVADDRNKDLLEAFGVGEFDQSDLDAEAIKRLPTGPVRDFIEDLVSAQEREETNGFDNVGNAFFDYTKTKLNSIKVEELD